MIDLEGLERAAADRGPERMGLVLQALAALERGQPFAGGVAPPEGYARMAAALATILADPELGLDEAGFQSLLIAAGLINNLFQASGVDVATAALETIAPGGAAGLPGLSQDARRRFLGLQGLDTPNDLGAGHILALPPDEALLAAISLLGSSPVLTPLGAARREALLAGSEILAGGRLAPRMNLVAATASAWMTCSYAAGADRHRLKPALNQVLKRLLAEAGHQPAPLAERARPARPCMVVMAEVMRSGHVQYRYFGQYLRQLRTRFRLVLVTPEREADDDARALFDEVFVFDPYGPSSFLQEVLAFVAAAAPDIVFWPSVGMARWGPLLANLRLAPIQMTALGHSASTFIPEMDYYLTEEGYVSDPALFSEKLLLLPDESLRFERHPRYRMTPPALRQSPDPLRVAIPSNMLKLNPAFLALLQRIRHEAARPIELHLFPNAGGVRLAALRAASPFLADAVIHPQTSAQDYVAALNQCDLVLSPFPFGGLHSVVDALRQGLPVIALEGAEPHNRTDAMILRRLGLPEELIAHSEAEYAAAALGLIADDARRLAIGREAIGRDIDRLLFGDATTPLGSEVVDAVWQAFQHHETIMADPRRAWPLKTLRALA